MRKLILSLLTLIAFVSCDKNEMEFADVVNEKANTLNIFKSKSGKNSCSIFQLWLNTTSDLIIPNVVYFSEYHNYVFIKQISSTVTLLAFADGPSDMPTVQSIVYGDEDGNITHLVFVHPVTHEKYISSDIELSLGGTSGGYDIYSYEGSFDGIPNSYFGFDPGDDLTPACNWNLEWDWYVEDFIE